MKQKDLFGGNVISKEEQKAMDKEASEEARLYMGDLLARCFHRRPKTIEGDCYLLVSAPSPCKGFCPNWATSNKDVKEHLGVKDTVVFATWFDLSRAAIPQDYRGGVQGALPLEESFATALDEKEIDETTKILDALKPVAQDDPLSWLTQEPEG